MSEEENSRSLSSTPFRQLQRTPEKRKRLKLVNEGGSQLRVQDDDSSHDSSDNEEEEPWSPYAMPSYSSEEKARNRLTFKDELQRAVRYSAANVTQNEHILNVHMLRMRAWMCVSNTILKHSKLWWDSPTFADEVTLSMERWGGECELIEELLRVTVVRTLRVVATLDQDKYSAMCQRMEAKNRTK